LVLTDASGAVLGGAGDPDTPLLLRSTAKPFQALAVLLSGAANAFGLSAEELAVVCGSHSGSGRHVSLVRGLLDRLGLSEADLACGPQPPGDREAARRLAEAGQAPSRLHNNCSGKHAGMLALARQLGAPVLGYERPEHPVQQTIAEVVGGLAGVPVATLFAGIDGCSAPVLGLPAAGLARLYAQLAEGRMPALGRIRDAMQRHPELVAAEDALDTRAMRAAPGRLLCKGGAEGLLAAGLAGGEAGEEVGLALKVEDGGGRALALLLGAVLAAWGLGEAAEAVGIRREVTDWAGQVVGGFAPLLGQAELRRREPGVPRRPGPEAPVRISVGSDNEREVTRFLRREWPRADEAVLGRTHDWNAERVVWVARCGSEVSGVLKALFVGGVAGLEELIVGERWRGRGVGTQLEGAFAREATRRGSHKAVVRTPLGSRAEAFYRAQGYYRESVLSRHHFEHDFLVMRKDLA